MRTVYQTLYSQAGNQIEVLDYKLLQQELQNLEVADIDTKASVEALGARLAKLTDEMITLNSFMKFCVEQRPETLTAYVTMLKAQDRLGVKP
jgi:DNA-binding ferritin-like protein (Dps family)